MTRGTQPPQLCWNFHWASISTRLGVRQTTSPGKGFARFWSTAFGRRRKDFRLACYAWKMSFFQPIPPTLLHRISWPVALAENGGIGCLTQRKRFLWRRFAAKWGARTPANWGLDNMIRTAVVGRPKQRSRRPKGRHFLSSARSRGLLAHVRCGAQMKGRDGSNPPLSAKQARRSRILWLRQVLARVAGMRRLQNCGDQEGRLSTNLQTSARSGLTP